MPTSQPRFAAFIIIAIAGLAASVPFARAGAQPSRLPDAVRGRHIATALAGCTSCHGATFGGGRAFVRGDVTIYAANITGGAGGVGALSDADLRRAIRGGVRPDGTRLAVMPQDYAVMTDADVDDLIAFLRSLPPVDRVVPRAAAAPPGGGAYIATIGGCTSCHGADLAGTLRPTGIAAPNISHDGIGSWSFADFMTALRTGKTPAGRTLSTAMPWPIYAGMTDGELRALYDFLESRSAAAAGPAR